MRHWILFLAFIFVTPPLFSDSSSCPKAFSDLMSHLASLNKNRLSVETIAPELKPVISEILKSGTRTREQHKQLARAIADYLSKYGVKTQLQASGFGGWDVLVKETTPDSPFKWAVNVPKALTRRFGGSTDGLFNTDYILNPYTPGFKGGSAQFRSSNLGDTAIVFSAQSLMGKHFHAPGDGHEVIHAKTHGGSIPQVILEAKNYKPTGKVGADLYGRVFSTDEIHSAYAFSVRTALKDIMKRNSEPAGEDAYTEVELTTLRNGLLNDLYQTAKPVYEAALKPGAIKKDLIKDNYGWGGDRTVLVETENGNSYWINFQSKQVNKWKLEQDPSASKDIDWSRDPKTVRALIERDYAASKQAARESDLLVGFLIGPNPQYESFLGAVDKVRQLRDFSTLTEKKVKKEEQIEAASRLLERGKNRLSESADTTQLAAALVRMQKRAAKENVPIPEGHLAFQRNDGSWITIDGNQKGNLPIQQILDEMLPPPQK